MIKKLVNSAVQAALIQGIVIDLKSKDVPLDPPLQPGEIPEMPMVRLDEIEIDRYKVPFFFVTGVLIGVAFGLRHGKVVVLR